MRRGGCRRGGAVAAVVPSQDGAHAGENLAEVERLRDVIVGSDLEADNAVDGVAFAGDHHDRDIVLGPDFAGEGESIFLPKGQIQRDEADDTLIQRGARRCGIGCFGHGIPFALEARPQQTPNFGFVVNNQDFRCHVSSPRGMAR
ncbi:hypothetical protein HYPGJ_30522 [Hyphomicrobium sp. GJ21]|nr:hypothetical protein HYPGJ_30522 [Hyphomicrobium sp. GJ21]